MEISGKIIAKKGDNKACRLDNGSWYNMNDNVVPYLEKAEKGDTITLTYEKSKGVNYASKLVKSGKATKAEEKESAPEVESEFKCKVCGKALKDDKYEVCFVCNKKGLKPKEEVEEEPVKEEKKNYDNPEKTAQIQRGNALNAAAMVSSGCGFSDPETAGQFVRELANNLLDWLRAEK